MLNMHINFPSTVTSKWDKIQHLWWWIEQPGRGVFLRRFIHRQHCPQIVCAERPTEAHSLHVQRCGHRPWRAVKVISGSGPGHHHSSPQPECSYIPEPALRGQYWPDAHPGQLCLLPGSCWCRHRRKSSYLNSPSTACFILLTSSNSCSFSFFCPFTFTFLDFPLLTTTLHMMHRKCVHLTLDFIHSNFNYFVLVWLSWY